MSIARSVRFAKVFAVLAALAAGMSSCTVPLKNAPPGGGAVVTQTFRLGPFNLGPNGSSTWQNQGSTTTVPRPSGSFGIKTMTFDLVDANGVPIDRMDVHLHHVVMMRIGAADPLCGNTRFGVGVPLSPFAASGAERTPIMLPDPYTYLVNSTDTWAAAWDVMNMSSSSKQVYIKYTIGYQPGATATNSRNVTPYFLDVNGCRSSDFNVPGNGGPGSVYTKTQTWTAPADGIAVATGGHLHDGGIDITASQVTPFGAVGCKSEPTYDGMGMLRSMSGCFDTRQAIIKNGTYQVTARYDNSTARPAVMGIMMSYVWYGTQ
ncbi:MAG: hypothetical protein HYX34_04200 [Actinobacteria bacterium]|nr:hypothetical protein [Actinomycetota bacterium]